jgi:transcriptional regulator with GAF, ATPase, and Fis domain
MNEFVAPQAAWTAKQEQQERQRLVRALAAAGGNKAKAARALGMPRSTLLSKLEKHGLVEKPGKPETYPASHS